MFTGIKFHLLFHVCAISSSSKPRKLSHWFCQSWDQEWWDQNPLENLSSWRPSLCAPRLGSLFLLLPILWTLWVEAFRSFIKACVSKGLSKSKPGHCGSLWGDHELEPAPMTILETWVFLPLPRWATAPCISLAWQEYTILHQACGQGGLG